MTLALVATAWGVSFRLRNAVLTSVVRVRVEAARVVGRNSSRSALEVLDGYRRARAVRNTRSSVTDFYQKLETFDPPLRHLFDVAGIDPGHVLIGSGRADNAFILSPGVFERDDSGRGYRLRPKTRAFWVRQETMVGGPVGMFLVPDTSEVRSAARKAEARIDEPSLQTTNSWGVRGPEPDLSARVRGLVLGDSFMLGMLNGDADTPPAALQRVLTERLDQPVSILNTGLMGYSPRQYFFTLKEFGPRFKPRFVVVSVCPNDFGKEQEVLDGGGTDWEEAGYWLERIRLWCSDREILCVLVPIPCDPQLIKARHDGFYPGRVSDLWNGEPASYCDPLPMFVSEHLRTQRLGRISGFAVDKSALHNTRVADGHLSPLGASLWARIVADRLVMLLDESEPAFAWPSGFATTPP